MDVSNAFIPTLEPVGTVAPRVSAGTSKIQTLDGKGSSNLTLQCPAQAFPVPTYRYIALNMIS